MYRRVCYYRWFVQAHSPMCVAHFELHKNVSEFFLWCGKVGGGGWVWCSMIQKVGGLYGVLEKLNPPRLPLMPSWDLSIVLAGLRSGPFEPLDSVELKFLSAKKALLTAVNSIKRFRDLQAFLVSEECLVFGPAKSHVVLRLRPGYVPKVPTTRPSAIRWWTCKHCPRKRQIQPWRCCVP